MRLPTAKGHFASHSPSQDLSHLFDGSNKLSGRVEVRTYATAKSRPGAGQILLSERHRFHDAARCLALSKAGGPTAFQPASIP